MQEFINYCFEHGSFLRNHKTFGEMANSLLGRAYAVDLHDSNDFIRHVVVTQSYHREWLVAIPPELEMSSKFYRITDPALYEPVKMYVLVYRFDKEVAPGSYAYVFSGIREQSTTI